MTQNSTSTGRRVVGNISLSLDGRVNGPGGDFDMSWVVPHAISDTAREIVTRIPSTATTVLLGRKNYEGFGGYWPAVARDETADPRDRLLAQWLDVVEKVVFSTTLKTADWNNSRIADADPAAVVRDLRHSEGGDIMVQNSTSIIRQLLLADELDRLCVLHCPAISGGGARLFEDGLPASSWRPTEVATSDSGAIRVYYDRVR